MINWQRPQVMGVINCSANSFYAPCRNHDEAFALAETMLADGVDIIDIGGEATNPFVDVALESPTVTDERDRIVPLVARIKKYYPNSVISIDTSSPRVMQAAIDAGADIINDQRALIKKGALDVVVNAQVPVILMHMPSGRIPDSCTNSQLLQLVLAELQRLAQRAIDAGVRENNIILDPGFGTGNYAKSTQENFYLLKNLPALCALGFPVLSGWSRKSMIGDVCGVDKQDRLFGSIAAATLSLHQGARIIRAHDVKATVDAVNVFKAYQKEAIWENTSVLMESVGE